MVLRWVVLGAALLLAGCVTVPPPALSVSDLQRYKLVGVSVENVQVISSWPAEEEAFLRTHPGDPELRNRLAAEPAYNFPRLTAHFQHVLDEQARRAFAASTDGVLAGPLPVRAVVRLKSFDVPSTARRVFVDSQARMQADIDLVDAVSGAVVLRYQGPPVSRRLIGGLATGRALALDQSDTGASMFAEYMSAYQRWLFRS